MKFNRLKEVPHFLSGEQTLHSVGVSQVAGTLFLQSVMRILYNKNLSSL